MNFNGLVVPTPDGETPFKVVISTGGTTLSEWPVQSVVKGQMEIIELLKRLGEIARDGR
jgi:hypothetical protein